MGQMANSKVLLSDLKCGRCFLHRRRQVAAIVGGQECDAKSETEEDEELRSFVKKIAVSPFQIFNCFSLVFFSHLVNSLLSF